MRFGCLYSGCNDADMLEVSDITQNQNQVINRKVRTVIEIHVDASFSFTPRYRRKKANMTRGEVHEIDKLASGDQQGNYELTQCPAYVTTTRKPHPHQLEDESSLHVYQL